MVIDLQKLVQDKKNSKAPLADQVARAAFDISGGTDIIDAFALLVVAMQRTGAVIGFSEKELKKMVARDYDKTLEWANKVNASAKVINMVEKPNGPTSGR